MSDNEFKPKMKNLVNALQNVCKAYSEIPDILEFEGRLSIFDKKFESIDKGDMTLLMSLFDMRIESGEVKQSSDDLGYHIAKAIDRLEYLLAKDDVREFLQGYFEEDFPNPAADYVRAVMETIGRRKDSDDVTTALSYVMNGASQKDSIVDKLKDAGESEERAKEVADKIDTLNELKLITHYYGWSVKERYKEYIQSALEDYV
ncbi:MAG: hypothetical protein GWP10_14380 [Nitrospiraceae bacterium]|nr:hypothetical protein [Nitrospiraceae bacterium]